MSPGGVHRFFVDATSRNDTKHPECMIACVEQHHAHREIGPDYEGAVVQLRVCHPQFDAFIADDRPAFRAVKSESLTQIKCQRPNAVSCCLQFSLSVRFPFPSRGRNVAVEAVTAATHP